MSNGLTTSQPDEKKKDKDISIPVLSPILTRKKSLAEEIAELDVAKFSCPVLPRKEDDAAAKTFRYEGFDIITLQKMIEREYKIPEPQTPEEVRRVFGQIRTLKLRNSARIVQTG